MPTLQGLTPTSIPSLTPIRTYLQHDKFAFVGHKGAHEHILELASKLFPLMQIFYPQTGLTSRFMVELYSTLFTSRHLRHGIQAMFSLTSLSYFISRPHDFEAVETARGLVFCAVDVFSKKEHVKNVIVPCIVHLLNLAALHNKSVKLQLASYVIQIVNGVNDLRNDGDLITFVTQGAMTALRVHAALPLAQRVGII